MNEIEISPPVQLTVLGVVIATILAAILVQMPELRRYLKIRSM